MFKILQNKQYLLFILNFLFLAVSLSASLFFWLSSPSLAQEGDSLAIQIRANPSHYSAARWYTTYVPEDRMGTPQSIADVDGYEAVRDGRTVYVNAGNLTANGVFHTNIYMLGFSQEPNSMTTKVHTNMLKHWTFNTNLIEPNDYGHCSVPSKVCSANEDCFDGYECRDYMCRLPVAQEDDTTCWRDKDCKSDKTGLYCSGKKARVTRRTKRLANLADIKSQFADFLSENEDNTLPDFAAGSYMPGITLSTWPSWNTTDNSLAELIHGGDLPIDPINTMGICPHNVDTDHPGYDPETCWDDVSLDFDGTFDDNIATGPSGGSFYGYSASAEVVYSFSTDGTIVCPLDGGDCYLVY